MSILIKNGRIITSVTDKVSDIYIEGDKIKAIGKNLDVKSELVIDADGLFVFPGGIDPHVHMHLPTPAGFSADDFHSGSIAALYGGTTTLIDFVTPQRGQSMVEALKLRIEEAKDSLADYSFHVSPVEWNKKIGNEIEECIGMGFPSFKIYMAYKNSIGIDDNALYHVMHAVAKHGGIVLAHCEKGDEIEQLRNSFYEQGNTSPKYHALSRPSHLEALAVRRAIDLADQTQCPLYIVHVSASESVKHIIQAQKSEQPLYAETCPQYLLLNESVYEMEFTNAAKFVMSPPIRSEKDNHTLWQAIANGNISSVGTDHCPFTMEQKMQGKDDFRKIPNGAGGVEHRLGLLYTYGVAAGKISLKKMVDVFSTQPAKLFGLYPKKGEIAVGSDADIVIWNPSKSSKISAKSHHSNTDISAWEGFNIKGEPTHVIKGGAIAIENGKLAPNIEKGNLLKRQTTGRSHYFKYLHTPGSNNCGRV
ncbi:dihydropyrimidinase [Tenuifilum thalassicum]|uniref:dihydropyrimidinase n=1 Tax=Tenuifilum thalassicum TaxID=2590900 RepID=UPI0015662E0D|nr:dihydropyrimidinase [Tenuifilum thalassicum]